MGNMEGVSRTKMVRLARREVNRLTFFCQAKVEMSYCYQSRNVLFRGLG